MKKIFVLGSMNMDLVISSPYLPQAGETIIGSDFLTNPGGKGANQAITCGKLGGEVFLIGTVGNDLYGKETLKNLKDNGVILDYIEINDDFKTGVAIILLTENDNRIIVDSGANSCINKKNLLNCLNTEATEGDIFISQFELPIEMVLYGLEKAKEKKLYTILNPAPAYNVNNKVFKNVDLLVINEIEAEFFSKIKPNCKESYFKIAQYFRQFGVKDIVISLGSKGGVIIVNEKILTYKAHNVKAVDTTAAGDAFIGSVAIELSNGENIYDAVKRANLVAALTVTKKGAQNSIPNKFTVDKIIKRGGLE